MITRLTPTVFDVEPIVPYQLCGSSTTEHRRLEVSSRPLAPEDGLKAIVSERER